MNQNWADKQKAAGITLELSQHKSRNCWKKYSKGKMLYFHHPISKEGYDAALMEWKESPMFKQKKKVNIAKAVTEIKNKLERLLEQVREIENELK